MRMSIFALSLAAAATALLSTAQAQTAERIGVAAAVRNQVTANQASQQRQLAVGSAVFQDELIRTGPSSVAQLLFADQTTLSIGPRCEVRLDRFVYNPNQSVGDVAIELLNGALRFVSGAQDPHSYSITTPVATVGVRGTIIDFLFLEGRMFAILNEGRVVFTLSDGREIWLNRPGTALEFFSDGGVSQPFTWRNRYEAGLNAASFPLYGNVFAETPHFEGAVSLDQRANRTDEIESRIDDQDWYDDDYYYDD